MRTLESLLIRYLTLRRQTSDTITIDVPAVREMAAWFYHEGQSCHHGPQCGGERSFRDAWADYFADGDDDEAIANVSPVGMQKRPAPLEPRMAFGEGLADDDGGKDVGF